MSDPRERHFRFCIVVVVSATIILLSHVVSRCSLIFPSI